MSEIKTPESIYHAIIDELVNDSNSISSKLITQNGIYSKASDSSNYNDFVQQLNLEQRNLLAEMLNKERISAIHNVLANLTWWIECGEVTLNFQGQVMPDSLSGNGMHGDYIGRLTDWEWPE